MARRAPKKIVKTLMEFFHKIKFLTENTINHDVTFVVILNIVYYSFGQQVLVTIFLFWIQNKKQFLQIMLAIYRLSFRFFFFGKKIYPKTCNFEASCFIKKCYWKENISKNSFNMPSLLTRWQYPSINYPGCLVWNIHEFQEHP